MALIWLEDLRLNAEIMGPEGAPPVRVLPATTVMLLVPNCENSPSTKR